MADKDSFNWFTSVVVPGVAALAGGSLGTYLGLFRHRKERGFERRLVWYEDTAKVLTAARADIDRGMDEMKGRRQNPEAVLTIISNHLDAIYLVRADDQLYASPAVVAALDAAFEKADRTFAYETNGLQAFDENSVRMIGEMYIELFDKAKHTIAKDVRRELHLEPLPAVSRRPS